MKRIELLVAADFFLCEIIKMPTTEADYIDKLYKNYDILSHAKDMISEVSFSICQNALNQINVFKLSFMECSLVIGAQTE